MWEKKYEIFVKLRNCTHIHIYTEKEPINSLPNLHIIKIDIEKRFVVYLQAWSLYHNVMITHLYKNSPLFTCALSLK